MNFSPVSSFNQPKFCPFISWNRTGIIFVGSSITGFNPTTVFGDRNDRIFVNAPNIHQILYWSSATTSPTVNISCYPCTTTYELFVTESGDIYHDNGQLGRVEKWTLNAMNYSVALFVPASPSGQKHFWEQCQLYRECRWEWNSRKSFSSIELSGGHFLWWSFQSVRGWFSQ